MKTTTRKNKIQKEIQMETEARLQQESAETKHRSLIKKVRTMAYGGSGLLGFGIGLGAGSIKSVIVSMCILLGICTIIDVICVLSDYVENR